MLAQPASAGFGQTPATAFPAAKHKTVTIIVVSALALLALFGGLFATGALRFGSALPEQSLQATGDQPPSSLPVAGSQPPTSLIVTGDQPPPNLQASNSKKVMPDDVRKWLEHLERIEKRRVDMSYAQVAKAMEMLVALQAGGTLEMLHGLTNEAMTGEESNSGGPVKETAQSAEEIRAKWRELLNDFNSYPPPTECVPIRNEYDVALRETGAMIGDILAAVEGAEANRDEALSGLMKMRGKSVTIDRAATKSDGLVQDICDKYDTRKWFKITADIGGGSFSRGGF